MERNRGTGGVTGSILSAALQSAAAGTCLCSGWRQSEGSSGLDGSAFLDLPDESDAGTDVDTDTTGPDGAARTVWDLLGPRTSVATTSRSQLFSAGSSSADEQDAVGEHKEGPPTSS